MKVKTITQEEPKQFKPITIEVTIESEEELCSLWHRLNANERFLDDYVGINNLKYGISSLRGMWLVIDDHVCKNNLIK